MLWGGVWGGEPTRFTPPQDAKVGGPAELSGEARENFAGPPSFTSLPSAGMETRSPIKVGSLRGGPFWCFGGCLERRGWGMGKDRNVSSAAAFSVPIEMGVWTRDR